jgi:hypothetical protein
METTKNEDSRLMLIQHAQIEMAETYKQLKEGKIGMREANGRANIMGKLLNGVRLEIDHYNLIIKMPMMLPEYSESIKKLTSKDLQNEV